MARLTAKARRALPTKDFALGKGHYPIEDKGHAKAALSEVAQHGTAAEKKRVRAAVHHKYPGMKISTVPR
jgi:hypothetical protein